MPATTSRLASPAIAVIVALLVSGCTDQTSTPAPTPAPSMSTPASATTAGSSTAPGPMTAQELVWLEAISRLHRMIDKVLVDSPSQLTPATLRSLAKQLRGCTGELARLGSPTERLRPVSELAERGCAQYDAAAKCFDTAASIGIPVAGTSEARKFDLAIDCGFAAPGKGSALLADAEVRGSEIKAAAG